MYFSDFAEWLVKKLKANRLDLKLKSIEKYTKKVKISKANYDDIMELSERYGVPPSDVLWLIIDYGFDHAERFIAVTDYENQI